MCFEDGMDIVQEVYSKTLQGEAKLAFSVWNIGEALGVLDIYQISKEEMDRKERLQ
ncbi:MAG: hypothetical protein QXV85_02770 [Candidatus Bathyarchaeia archaeon]